MYRLKSKNKTFDWNIAFTKKIWSAYKCYLKKTNPEALTRKVGTPVVHLKGILSLWFVHILIRWRGIKVLVKKNYF